MIDGRMLVLLTLCVPIAHACAAPMYDSGDPVPERAHGDPDGAPGGKTDIYGSDDRLEWYETDVDVRAVAEVTGLLVQAAGLVELAHGAFELDTVPLSEQYELCDEERFLQQPVPRTAVCTAFLVAPDIAITAGHCISSRDCADRRIVLGYRAQLDGSTPTIVDATRVFSCAEVLARRLVYGADSVDDELPDYAVFRLDRADAAFEAPALRRSGGIRVGEELAIVGHPLGLPLKVAAGARVVRILPSGMAVTDLDAYGGSSGSPVIAVESGEIVGLLSFGSRDFDVRDSEESGWCRRSRTCTEVDASGLCIGQGLTPLSAALALAPAP